MLISFFFFFSLYDNAFALYVLIRLRILFFLVLYDYFLLCVWQCDWFYLVNSMLNFQHGIDVYGGAIV